MRYRPATQRRVTPSHSELKPLTISTGGPEALAATGGSNVRAFSTATDTAKPAAVPPTTKTSTPARPTTTNGRRRGCGDPPARACTSWSQHHALATPTRPAITTWAGPDTRTSTAPAAVTTRKVIRTTRTVSQVGRSRHHDAETGARCSSSAAMTSTGTETKNSHERDTTAIAKVSTANGSNTSATSTVMPTVDRSWSRHAGRSTVAGQAARTSPTMSTLRTTTSARTSNPKASQEGW